MLFGFIFFLESIFSPTLELVFRSIRYILLAGIFLITYKRRKLSLWIFSSMALGIEVGLDFPSFALETERFGKIFLRLVKSLVSPLIFSTLVVGIAGHSNIKQLGRIGLKSILYFEIVTTIALFVGL
jgi:proton glutamate symport protein